MSRRMFSVTLPVIGYYEIDVPANDKETALERAKERLRENVPQDGLFIGYRKGTLSVSAAANEAEVEEYSDEEK